MVVAITYRRIIIPLTTKSFQIKQHQVIAQNVHHTTLTGKPFRYWPGQFMMIQFQTPGITREWHPFTISSAPSDPNLTVSMKESGDWTATLSKLTIGTKAKMEGPYGKFSYQVLSKDTTGYVFMAGGIGITPLRSMIRELCHGSIDRPITLLYNAKTMPDFAFKDEFDALMKQHPNLKIVYITSQEKTVVRFGRIDANCIQEEIKQIPEQQYFICGPKPMMTAVRQTLAGLGVARTHIHCEEFSL
ncbi:MAG: Oxidoreductase FAD/NAD(P)-binding protein [uncultured bacterium]|nr:MAG: Oxidoreductase FAD/NAD(P)-binding protein [uncultured bacterium]